MKAEEESSPMEHLSGQRVAKELWFQNLGLFIKSMQSYFIVFVQYCKLVVM